MNKDTIIGFVLIALVLIGFSWYNQPSAEEIEAARKQDSIAAAIKDNAARLYSLVLFCTLWYQPANCAEEWQGAVDIRHERRNVIKGRYRRL